MDTHNLLRGGSREGESALLYAPLIVTFIAEEQSRCILSWQTTRTFDPVFDSKISSPESEKSHLPPAGLANAVHSTACGVNNAGSSSSCQAKLYLFRHGLYCRNHSVTATTAECSSTRVQTS